MGQYTSVAELKGFLNLYGAEDDAPLDAMIEAASRLIDVHCGRSFDDAATTATARVFSARYGDLLVCDDISSTDGLVVETDSGGDGTFDQTWSASDYQLEPLNQRYVGMADHPFFVVRAIGSRSFPCAKQSRVRVTAKWGWPSGVPDTVREACNHVVKGLHTQRQSVADAVGFEGGGMARIRTVSRDAERMLAPFVRADKWV